MASARQILRLQGSGTRQNDAGPAPIPDGVKLGNMVFSSLVAPSRDPATNAHFPDAERQAESMFQNLEKMLAMAGGTPDNIGQLTLYFKSEDARGPINKEWVKMFPDANDRPARIVVYRDFGSGGLLFEASFIAVL